MIIKRPSTEAIVLAGGFGTRLASVLTAVPKPMAPIASRPFLYYLLDLLRAQGIGRVIIAIHYMASQIQSIGNHYRGMEVVYLYEEAPLGTGGAIRRSLNFIEGSNALVLNGDTYLSVDYEQIFRHQFATQSDIVMALRSVADVSRYSLVEIRRNGCVKKFTSKGEVGQSGLIGAGVYAIRRKLFDDLNFPMQIFSFESDFLLTMFNKIKIQSYLCNGYFIDIGVPEDYQRAQTELPQLDGINISG